MNEEEQPVENSALERAQRIMEDLSLLNSERIEQAFAQGALLIEWEEKQLGDVMGHSTQEEVILLVGMRRSTALSNKRLAQKFDLAQVRHIGLGKLRLLAANYVEDPVRVIYDGIEVEDGNGGTKRFSVEDLSYRELQALLKAKKAAAKVVKRSEEESELAREIQEATAPALASFVSSKETPALEPASKAKKASRVLRALPKPSDGKAKPALKQGFESALTPLLAPTGLAILSRSDEPKPLRR